MASIPVAGYDVARLPDASISRKTTVLLVSSVALSFISFWRAAAIVLCDLASSAYYIGGISEQAIGKAAPWFILGVMLFSYAVRAVYVESCMMFTRGGVYRVVKEAMGGSLAKLSVSALMFDYVLTGPISAVAAGQYLLGLASDMLTLITTHTSGAQHALHFSADHPGAVRFLSMLIAISITLYFWRTNIIGIGESSDKAMKIMKLTTVMGVCIIGWSVVTLLVRPHVAGAPSLCPPFRPVLTDDSAGWLSHLPKLLGGIGILVAFGHSVLAMSGEESLAQVNREIQAPKRKNLLRTGFVIFIYSMLLTSAVSFLAVMIIPDGKRVKTEIVDKIGTGRVQVDYIRHDPDGVMWGHPLENAEAARPTVSPAKVYFNPASQEIKRDDGGYRDNLINGLAHYLAGPDWLKIGMQAFVVVVGFLILAGAVNTAIVGSNGVMNRLAEDGVLTSWFLHPQTRYGTTHRLINLIAILQLFTIVASWGDVNTLGEAYAFGVIWSFVFKTLAMVVLRFKDKSKREYEVPGNIRVSGKRGQIDLPIGIGIIFLVLLSTALVNLATKKEATKWGLGFTAAFLAVFIVCERIAHRRRQGQHHEHMEQFNEATADAVTAESLGLRHPDPIVVAARGPRSLDMLQRVLEETNTDERDVVVVTCKVLPPRLQGITEQETRIDDADRELLTKIVTVAEEVGKQVHPVVLPTNNPLYAIATTACNLNASEVVLGVSEKMHGEMQLEQFAMAWGSATCERGSAIHHPLVKILGPGVRLEYAME